MNMTHPARAAKRAERRAFRNRVTAPWAVDLTIAAIDLRKALDCAHAAARCSLAWQVEANLRGALHYKRSARNALAASQTAPSPLDTLENAEALLAEERAS